MQDLLRAMIIPAAAVAAMRETAAQAAAENSLKLVSSTTIQMSLAIVLLTTRI